MKIECVYCGAPVMEPKAYGAIKCTYCRKSNLVDGFETSADDGEIKLNNSHLSEGRFDVFYGSKVLIPRFATRIYSL